MDVEPANWQAARSQRQRGLSIHWRHFEQKWCRAMMAPWPAAALLVFGWKWPSPPAPTMEKELWGSSSQGLWWRAWSQRARVHAGLKGKMCLRGVLPLEGMGSTIPRWQHPCTSPHTQYQHGHGRKEWLKIGQPALWGYCTNTDPFARNVQIKGRPKLHTKQPSQADRRGNTDLQRMSCWTWHPGSSQATGAEAFLQQPTWARLALGCLSGLVAATWGPSPACSDLLVDRQWDSAAIAGRPVPARPRPSTAGAPLHRSPPRSSQRKPNVPVVLSPQWHRNIAVCFNFTEGLTRNVLKLTDCCQQRR